jgi:hypothetical protein
MGQKRGGRAAILQSATPLPPSAGAGFLVFFAKPSTKLTKQLTNLTAATATRLGEAGWLGRAWLGRLAP